MTDTNEPAPTEPETEAPRGRVLRRGLLKNMPKLVAEDAKLDRVTHADSAWCKALTEIDADTYITALLKLASTRGGR